LLSGLRFAAIAFLPEREVEVVAIKTDPISLATLRCRFGSLEACLYLLDWRKKVHITFEFIFRFINGAFP
jgi:hypothetical protein